MHNFKTASPAQALKLFKHQLNYIECRGLMTVLVQYSCVASV